MSLQPSTGDRLEGEGMGGGGGVAVSPDKGDSIAISETWLRKRPPA